MHHGKVDKVNGVADLINDDPTCWILVYSSKELIFHAQHIGQITTGDADVDIECLASEAEMLKRIDDLGFKIEAA